MLTQKSFRQVIALAAVVLVSGCASLFFPDFDEPSETVIDDGGKVEVHKIQNEGILVSDKENASHEGEESSASDGEEKADSLEPAKVIEVKAEKIENDTVKTVEGAYVEKTPEKAAPSMHYLAETIYFENGGTSVAAAYRPSLKKIAKIAKEHGAIVSVYGFASSRTRDTDPATHKLINFKASADRAENTAKALRALGVKPEQIVVQALSDSAPLYQEVMPEGERLNRRAEIYLTY